MQINNENIIVACAFIRVDDECEITVEFQPTAPFTNKVVSDSNMKLLKNKGKEIILLIREDLENIKNKIRFDKAEWSENIFAVLKFRGTETYRQIAQELFDDEMFYKIDKILDECDDIYYKSKGIVVEVL